MYGLILTTVVITLSGAMAPGPITAAALAAGSRSRHAGAVIGLGHIAVELPLLALLLAGLAPFLQSAAVQSVIGLAGGLFLVLMGAMLLTSARKAQPCSGAAVERHPFWTGVVLSGANPYFLVWWATVGLSLASQAMTSGMLALGLFALIHWLCDLGWLEMLSLAGFKGSERFGGRSRQVLAGACAAALIGFGMKFAWDAAMSLGE
mgnify:CR=1 FL=1